MDNFPTRLRQLRLARGLTQGKLAARASLYTSDINRYENGKHMPSSRTLARLAWALDVSVETLVRDQEDERR